MKDEKSESPSFTVDEPLAHENAFIQTIRLRILSLQNGSQDRTVPSYMRKQWDTTLHPPSSMSSTCVRSMIDGKR